MNLSPTEKDLIKQEIQHKEAELYRLWYANIKEKSCLIHISIGELKYLLGILNH